MKKIHVLMLAILVAFLFSGCGGSGEKISGSNRVEEPDWFGLQDDPNYVHTYGSDTSTNQELAIDGAKTLAFEDAANYVKTKVEAMIKRFSSESGYENPEVNKFISNTAKLISDAEFSGAMPTKREIYKVETEQGLRYRAYIRLSIPAEAFNKNLMNEIRHEEAMYNEFKASQSFKELENTVGGN